MNVANGVRSLAAVVAALQGCVAPGAPARTTQPEARAAAPSTPRPRRAAPVGLGIWRFNVGVRRTDPAGRAYRLLLKTDLDRNVSTWWVDRGEHRPERLVDDLDEIVRRDSDLRLSCRRPVERRALRLGTGPPLPVLVLFLEDEVVPHTLAAMAGLALHDGLKRYYVFVERYYSLGDAPATQTTKDLEADVARVLETLRDELDRLSGLSGAETAPLSVATESCQPAALPTRPSASGREK